MLEVFENQISESGKLAIMLKLLYYCIEAVPHILHRRISSRGASLNRRSHNKFSRLSAKLVLQAAAWVLIFLLPSYLVRTHYKNPILGSKLFYDIANISFFIAPAVVVVATGAAIYSLVRYRSGLYSRKTSAGTIIKKSLPALPAMFLSMGALSALGFTLFFSQEGSQVKHRRASIIDSSLSCSIFGIEEAKKYLGTGVIVNDVLNNQRSYYKDTLYLEHNDPPVLSGAKIIDSECVYGSRSTIGVIKVGVRDVNNALVVNDLESRFFSYKEYAEQGVEVSGFDGFYHVKNNTVFLRLWVTDRWVDVSSDSLDTAIGAAQTIAEHLAHQN